MNSWPQHLVVGSMGLCVAAFVALLLLRTWRRQPLVSYRMVVAVLVATLVLPLGQLVAQKTGLMETLPFAGRFAAFAPLADGHTVEERADELADIDADGRTVHVVAYATDAGAALDPTQALDEERQRGLARALARLAERVPVIVATTPGAFADELWRSDATPRRRIVLDAWDGSRGARVAADEVEGDR